MLLNGLARAGGESAVAFLGRALLSVIFLWGGVGKALAAAATTARFAGLGLPAPELAYLLAVVVELGGGLLLLVGLSTRPTAVVLGLWCIATALIAHTDFGDRNMQIHLMKNVAMAGGFVYVAIAGAGAFSLDALFAGRMATAGEHPLRDDSAG
jgi:putative oxidoreductase